MKMYGQMEIALPLFFSIKDEALRRLMNNVCALGNFASTHPIHTLTHTDTQRQTPTQMQYGHQKSRQIYKLNQSHIREQQLMFQFSPPLNAVREHLQSIKIIQRTLSHCLLMARPYTGRLHSQCLCEGEIETYDCLSVCVCVQVAQINPGGPPCAGNRREI